MKRVLLILLALALAGCTTVKISSVGDHHMCVIANSSWRLFNVFPIVSGNPDKPNEISCCWFSNSLTLENNMKILNSEMATRGFTAARDITSRKTDEQVLFILFNRKTYYTSAELVP